MRQSVKQKEWKQKNYVENKEYYRIKQQNRRNKIKLLVDSLKQPCVICGEDDKCCLDFHHRNPEEKSFELGKAGEHKWSDKKLIEEISKCVSICSNHHRQLHYYDLTIDELICKYNQDVAQIRKSA